MLKNTKMKLASLALAGGLAVAFSSAASAQQWSEPDHDAGITLIRYHGIAGHHVDQHGYPYAYGYYRHGYDGYGPLGVGGAIVGSALGAADTAVAAATGYPYYGRSPYYGQGYYGPAGYDSYYNNGGWGPYQNQYGY